jgi:transglycosylase-like protein with SLT domain
MSKVRLRLAPLILGLGLFAATAAAEELRPGDFPALPLPPAVEGLGGLASDTPAARQSYLSALNRAAEENGLPPALADAVAFVESGYAADAAGADGEVGLMQILPTTAALLGHSGDRADLFEPRTNIRYGVLYLAQAWQLANGDLCRALMKYRAGHGEERMSALSVRYCARVRAYLASIGSSLAALEVPPAVALQGLNVASAPRLRTAALTARAPTPRWRLPGRPGRPRTEADSRRFWAEHQARIRAINARLRTIDRRPTDAS